MPSEHLSSLTAHNLSPGLFTSRNSSKHHMGWHTPSCTPTVCAVNPRVLSSVSQLAFNFWRIWVCLKMSGSFNWWIERCFPSNFQSRFLSLLRESNMAMGKPQENHWALIMASKYYVVGKSANSMGDFPAGHVYHVLLAHDFMAHVVRSFTNSLNGGFSIANCSSLPFWVSHIPLMGSDHPQYIR